MRQIQGYNNDLTRITSEKAVISKKIADKRQKHADTVIKLQKEEAEAERKAIKAQQAIQESCFLQEEIPHFCKEFSPGTGGEFLC